MLTVIHNGVVGCISDVQVSKPSWHKVIYVAVHVGVLDMTFHARVIMRCIKNISCQLQGKAFSKIPVL